MNYGEAPGVEGLVSRVVRGTVAIPSAKEYGTFAPPNEFQPTRGELPRIEGGEGEVVSGRGERTSSA